MPPPTETSPRSEGSRSTAPTAELSRHGEGAPEPGHRGVGRGAWKDADCGAWKDADYGTWKDAERPPHPFSRNATSRNAARPRLGRGQWRDLARRVSALTSIVLVLGLALGAAVAATPVANRPKRIVTTFTILADIARNVAGDKAEILSITKPGAEIHDYEPTPLDIVKAQSADLVLWNGLGLERWFQRFFQDVHDVPSVTVSESIEPIGIAEGPYLGKPNPHAWMSPANALVYVENIRKALVALDPENAATYDANAAAYSARLSELDRPVAAMLARIPADRRILVSCEGAFSYLARNYGLKELYLWAINADEEGTPQQIRKVIDEARKARVPVTFCESTVNDKPMRQVAKEAGARFGGTLYVDSLTAEDGPAPTYLKLVEYNAKLILQGFDVTF